MVTGRSDDTIKVAGKRLGPAEVESILVGHPSVIEAAAIGIPDPVKGNSIVCFSVLKEGALGNDSLEEELRQRLISELGKPMAPKQIHFIPDIPKTRNAKVMRRVLRASYLGEEPGDISSLVNPESLDAIASLKS
jgi:acetyl-CoA synthetase